MLINKKLQGLNSYENGNIEDFSTYIKLDANESFIDISEKQKDLLKSEIDNIKFNRYPDMVALKVQKAFGAFYNVDIKNITVGNGSDELISVVINGFCEPNDTVLTFSPDFSMYNFYSYLADIKCIEIPKENDFKINVDAVIQKVKETNPRIVIFSNPCNPTGIQLTKGEIAKIAQSTKSIVVVDEAYMDFSNQSIIDEFYKFENIIILKTASKAFGLAALRLGIAISSEIITKKLIAVKSPYNINSLSCALGSIILSDDVYLKDCIDKIKTSCDYLYENLKNIGFDVIHTTTNFVVVKTSKSDEIYDFLLSEKIIVRKFDGFLRITAGNDIENNIVINSLKKWELR